jgi:hypothetical protein
LPPEPSSESRGPARLVEYSMSESPTQTAAAPAAALVAARLRQIPGPPDAFGYGHWSRFPAAPMSLSESSHHVATRPGRRIRRAEPEAEAGTDPAPAPAAFSSSPSVLTAAAATAGRGVFQVQPIDSDSASTPGVWAGYRRHVTYRGPGPRWPAGSGSDGGTRNSTRPALEVTMNR